MKGEKIFFGIGASFMELTLQEKHKLINFFEFLLDEETSKPMGEMNSEAVDNYVKILLHLQDKRVELSPEFIDEQVRKIFHPEETAAPETAKTTKKQYNKNKIWLVAACVSILVALFSILSFSSEKRVADILEDFFGTYLSIPFGKEIELGNETYGKESSARTYKSIEELTKTEKIDLLYPLNNQNKIKLISVSEIDGKETINISYVESDLFVTIIPDSDIPQETIDICNDKIIINGIDCYLCIMEDVTQAQAYFIYNNGVYRIIHTDKISLMEILKNMEDIRYED